MKKLLLIPVFLILSGCASSTTVQAPDQSLQMQTMRTWFRYHSDWVAKLECSSSLQELNYNAEETIMVRQGICRDLREAQEDGALTPEQVSEWYSQYRVALGKENIVFCDTYLRLQKR
jgi:uncharacterized protein YceK